MTFATAERAHEAQERADYSELLEGDDRIDEIEEQIISGYMQDAHDGTDDDWVRSDEDRTHAAMMKIAKIIASDDEPAAKVCAVRSIIHAVQAAAALFHLEVLRRKGLVG